MRPGFKISLHRSTGTGQIHSVTGHYYCTYCTLLYITVHKQPREDLTLITTLRKQRSWQSPNTYSHQRVPIRFPLYVLCSCLCLCLCLMSEVRVA